MARLARMALSVIAGLILGWTVAGAVPGVGVSHAEDTDHRHGDLAGQGRGHGDSAVLIEDAAHAGDDPTHGHQDTALQSARLLVPREQDIRWFGPVLATTAGLFVVAAAVGIPAVIRRNRLSSRAAADQGRGDAGH